MGIIGLVGKRVRVIESTILSKTKQVNEMEVAISDTIGITPFKNSIRPHMRTLYLIVDSDPLNSSGAFLNIISQNSLDSNKNLKKGQVEFLG